MEKSALCLTRALRLRSLLAQRRGLPGAATSSFRGLLGAMAVVALMLLVTGCDATPQPEPTATPPAASPVAPGIPNPASVYCGQNGGRLEIRRDAQGNETGYCIFVDGSECEEWAFFRGECQPGVPPTNTPSAEPAASADVAAAVRATLPLDAFEGVRAFPLQTAGESQPLWAVHTIGLRNYNVDPVPSHFVALYTHGDGGWQELARVDLDTAVAPSDGPEPIFTDYLAEGGVTQVKVEPSRVWLQVEGGAGAHDGTFHLLSFDGQELRTEVLGTAASPGVGRVVDLNADGLSDVVLDQSDHYVFCYACDVVKPAFSVYTWVDDGMLEVYIADLLMGQQGQPFYEPNSDAVMLAEADLWQEALAKIAEARSLAGVDDPPSGAGSLRWNEALIRLHHDAHLAAIEDSAYPLLSKVFYGDYAGAVDLMRSYSIEEIFSPQSPLLVDTVAQDWKDALSGRLLEATAAVLRLRPQMAPAYFLRAWAEYLADPTDPRTHVDLLRASMLAPDDPLFAAARELTFGGPTPPTPSPQIARMVFDSGSASAIQVGALTSNRVQPYMLKAEAGQTLDVAVTTHAAGAQLEIVGADGTVLKPADELLIWQGLVPVTQDYLIRLMTGNQGGPYQLRVKRVPADQ